MDFAYKFWSCEGQLVCRNSWRESENWMIHFFYVRVLPFDVKTFPATYEWSGSFDVPSSLCAPEWKDKKLA